MKRSPQTLQSMKGFTLVEPTLVVAIIGILAAIAIPSHRQYTRKGKFTEVIAATWPHKLSMDLCCQDGTCQGGTTAASTVTIPTDRWGGQIPANNATAKNMWPRQNLSAAGQSRPRMWLARPTF